MAFFNNKSTQTESEIIVFSHKCTQTESVVVHSETINTELKKDTEEIPELQLEDAPSGSSRYIGNYASGGQPEDVHTIYGRLNGISKSRPTPRLWQRFAKALLYGDMKRSKYMDIKMHQQIQWFADLKRNSHADKQSGTPKKGSTSTPLP